MKMNFRNHILIILCLSIGITIIGCGANAQKTGNEKSKSLSENFISTSSDMQSESVSDKTVSSNSSSTFSEQSGVSENSNGTSIASSSNTHTSVLPTTAINNTATVILSKIASTPPIINAKIAFYNGKKVYKMSADVSNGVFGYYRPDGLVLYSKLTDTYHSPSGSLTAYGKNSAVELNSIGVGFDIFSKNNIVLSINHRTEFSDSYSPPMLHKSNIDGSNKSTLYDYYLYNAFQSGDYIYGNAFKKDEMMLIPPVVTASDITTGIRVNINNFSYKVYGKDIRFISQNSCFTNDDYVLYTKFSNKKELYLLNNKTDKSIKITDKGYVMTAIINGYLLYQDEKNDVRAILLSDCGKKTPIIISKSLEVSSNNEGTFPTDEYFIDTNSHKVDDAFFNGGYSYKYFMAKNYKEMRIVLFSGKSFSIEDAYGYKPLFVVGNNLYLFKAKQSATYIQNALINEIVVYDIRTGTRVLNPDIPVYTYLDNSSNVSSGVSDNTNSGSDY